MKLILCKRCNDLIKLDYLVRTCKCGKTGGKYTNQVNAKYFGEDAIPLGIDNFSLSNAIVNTDMKAKRGNRIESFVITDKCETLDKVTKQDLI